MVDQNKPCLPPPPGVFDKTKKEVEGGITPWSDPYGVPDRDRIHLYFFIMDAYLTQERTHEIFPTLQGSQSISYFRKKVEVCHIKFEIKLLSTKVPV